MGEVEKFHYIYRCDVDINVHFNIGRLEGKREQKSYKAVLEDPMLKFSGLYQETCSDLYVTCQVFAGGKPLALPVRPSYKAFSMRWNWNEWLKLPVKYPDWPRNAQVALTIWDVSGQERQCLWEDQPFLSLENTACFARGCMTRKSGLMWKQMDQNPQKLLAEQAVLSEDQVSSLAKLPLTSTADKQIMLGLISGFCNVED